MRPSAERAAELGGKTLCPALCSVLAGAARLRGRRRRRRRGHCRRCRLAASAAGPCSSGRSSFLLQQLLLHHSRCRSLGLSLRVLVRVSCLRRYERHWLRHSVQRRKTAPQAVALHVGGDAILRHLLRVGHLGGGGDEGDLLLVRLLLRGLDEVHHAVARDIVEHQQHHRQWWQQVHRRTHQALALREAGKGDAVPDKAAEFDLL
mmetsp:Transcript_11126/g.40784  ORF Transcript_11126/g.40784 Transcript_11126/m.40784 type:complete len:205 (+) Transcript_11126:377-991(+)